MRMQSAYVSGLENDAKSKTMSVVINDEESKSSDVLNMDFPTVEWEGMQVPEARSYLQTLLPHQCKEQSRLFPTAQVSDQPEDRDRDRQEFHWWKDGDDEGESEEEEMHVVASFGISMRSSEDFYRT